MKQLRRPLIQFSSRALLLAVTITAVVCAVISALPAPWFVKAMLGWVYVWVGAGWVGLGLDFGDVRES